MDTEKQSLETILNGIVQRNGGTITPENVLSEAKKASSPLHGYFEWDDSAAAAEYRLIQAAQLIRRVRITYGENKTQHFRAFVSVTPETVDEDESPRGHYVPFQTAMSTPNYREQLLASARRDALTFSAKYAALQEAEPVIRAMKRLTAPPKSQGRKQGKPARAA